MAKLVEKVYTEPKRIGGRSSIPVIRRPVAHRKATNHEILRDAFRKYEDCRLNIVLRIRDENGSYQGYNGVGFTVILPMEEAAKKFPDKLLSAAVQIAKEFGGTATRRDAPL